MPRLEELWNETGTDTERLVFFSDAVFAIALTLLVINIHVPEIKDASALPTALWSIWPDLLSFLISFFVINHYWQMHHHMFRVIERYDRRLFGMNTLLLLGISLQPFATSMVRSYGSQPVVMMIYVGGLAFTGSIFTLMWIYATTNHRLVAADLNERYIRYETLRQAFAAGLFGISIGLPFIMPPTWVPFIWLLNAPFGRLILWIAVRRNQRFGMSKPKPPSVREQ